MTNTNNSIKYRDVDDFLHKHQIIKPKNGPPINTKVVTNTRIGDKEANIFGGAYHIPDEEYELFLSMYYRDVIAKNKKDYLTEKQQDDGGVILVDLDLRHDYDVDERQYSKDHVEDLIEIYLDELKKMYQFDESTRFHMFVFEKPTVNRVADKKFTKDGIHMMICLKADHITQRILRDKVMPRVAEAWSDLPITNSWTDVFDAGISAGHTNWQLYGSRKPNHVSYKLRYVYDISYDPSDGEFMRPEIPVQEFDVSKNISILSVRYKNHLSPFMKTAFITEYDEYKRVNRLGMATNTRPTVTGNAAATNVLMRISGNGDGEHLSQIRSMEELDTVLNHWLDNLPRLDNDLKDIYEYVMILPVEYYGEQSYDKWIRVGWALKNVSEKLLIVWLKFSSKSSTFQVSQIMDLCDQWRKFDRKCNGEGLTKRSIMYWAKQDARDAFEAVRRNTLDYYVEQTINTISAGAKGDDKSGCGEWDLANVLYQLYKYEFICVSPECNVWYQYKNNRWKRVDSGITLRRAISEELRDVYHQKSMIHWGANSNDINTTEQLNNLDQEETEEKKVNSRSRRILSIMQRLTRTTDKQHIMKEAQELFYDPEFLDKLDMDINLLCFRNGVFDFKEKAFRNGRPEDHLSMCTNIDYVQLDPFTHQPIMDEINSFMCQLFPEPALCNYMWDHLASTLVGTTANQTFNMYVGNGRNGKSVLVQLMTEILGEYKGDVPLSLVTAERTKIGGVSPEIVDLKGKRYAVMQEPKKGDKMNEGIMKQLTGKDPITGRGLFVPKPLTFIPQFKLVVTCNNLLEVNSMDHGTWRRIRAVPFKSLFTENPVQDDEMKPYQFAIDPFIDEKFDSWKEVFMAMLVKRVCETEGIVKDCEIVTERSDQYRNEQDSISSFVKNMIVKEEGGQITKTGINQAFKLWFNDNIGGGKQPAIRELHEYMDTHFGKPVTKVWKGVNIFIDRTENDDVNELDINRANYDDVDDV